MVKHKRKKDRKQASRKKLLIYLDGKPINFNKWNVKHLTYTICTLCTFEDTNWESIDISKWNTSYLAETRDMFGACNKKNIRIKKFPVK